MRIANKALSEAALLDCLGCPLRDVAVDRAGAAAVVHVPAETMYLILSGN